MADLKETKELINGVKLVGVAAKKIFKDGKVGADDLAILLPLLQQSEQLVSAFVGINEVQLEVKDLNLMEAQELLTELFNLVKEIKEA